MCGIAGYVCTGEGQLDPRLSSAFTLMSVFMTERGTQSWGWTNGTDVYKDVGRVRSKFLHEFTQHKAAMVHTRHATTGAIVKENSHPFAIGNIIGVHNGMIYNHSEMAKKYPDRNAVVDSEHIFHHIVNGDDLSELKGYGAIVFWQDGILNIGRFNGGDMCLAKTSFGWVYASTKEAVVDSMYMSGLEEEIKFYVKMKEGVLYQLIDDRIVRSPLKLSISSTRTTQTWQNSGYKAPTTAPYTGQTGSGFSVQGVHYKDTADFLSKTKPASGPIALPAPKVVDHADDLGFPDDADTEDAYWNRRHIDQFFNKGSESNTDCWTCARPSDDLCYWDGHLMCEECFADEKRYHDLNLESASTKDDTGYFTEFTYMEYQDYIDPTGKVASVVWCDICSFEIQEDASVFVGDDDTPMCKSCYRELMHDLQEDANRELMSQDFSADMRLM